MHEALLSEEVEGAVHGRRRDLAPGLCLHRREDVVGAGRTMPAPDKLEDLPAERGTQMASADSSALATQWP